MLYYVRRRFCRLSGVSMATLANPRHEAFAQALALGMQVRRTLRPDRRPAHGCTGLKVLRLIEETMEIDELPENDERLLRKPEIKRDEMA
jgi:hypothetical protein